jgi:hypothetical protein
MQFTTRIIEPGSRFPLQMRLDVLARVIPPATVQAVFEELALRTPRVRKLRLELLVWLVIAMSLYADLAIEAAFAKLCQGLRLLWPDEATYLSVLPTKSALSYRRQQLGVRPLRCLFHRVCRPLAVPATRGAFLQGLRLMAIDGHLQDVPDTPANAAVFGRSTTDRGESAFPQVLCVSLCECGTHAIIDTAFWPCGTGEHRGLWRLLRSLTAEMLVLLDRGLFGFDLVHAIRERQAHVLVRVSKQIQPERLRRLPDGSTLVRLRRKDHHGRPTGEPQVLRLIEYTLTDPQAPGYGERYRLLTTLLDQKAFPALTLARRYHERWEIELTIDEQDTHLLRQRHPSSPLRSRTPAGVIQELYGLMLAHYLLRALMHEAALAADEDPDRLSFTHALRIIQAAVSDFELVPTDHVERLFQRLFRDLTHRLLPEREPRVAPRVVRRKVIKWPLKRAEHRRVPQPTRPAWASVQLI